MHESARPDEAVQRLIATYLEEVAVALADLPPAQRREILDDLRAHIADALAAAPEQNEAAVRNILDRMGTPDDLARDARERLGISPPPTAAALGEPGLLEYAAIVLTALLWPIGILLAWSSAWWQTRHKVIATLIGVLGIMAVVFGLISFTVVSGTSVTAEVVLDVPVYVGEGTPTAEATPPTGPAEPSRRFWRQVGEAGPRILVLPLILLIPASPLLSAGYLAYRLRHPGRRRSRPRDVVGAVHAT